jgi:EAL and modified HD-GYP domain-containing signal transduction protein
MRPPHVKTNENEDWTETPLDPAAPSLDPNQYLFLARQAIFDPMGEIYGYELLFRSGSDNYFTGDSDTATQAMVENWLLHGFEGLRGPFPFFLNCTGEALVKGLVTLLPRTRTVLELLETVEPSEEVVSACRRLKRIGYGIALDDFQFSKEMEPLVELADYVKIDFRLSDKQRKKTLRQLKGSGVKLVAEKVETEEELRTAFDEGFDLFQGYFLACPGIFSKRKTPVDTTRYLRMLTAMTASWLEDQNEDDVAGEPRSLHQPQLDSTSWQSWCA